MTKHFYVSRLPSRMVVVYRIRIQRDGVYVELVPNIPIALNKREMTLLEDFLYGYGSVTHFGRIVVYITVYFRKEDIESMGFTTIEELKFHTISFIEGILRKVMARPDLRQRDIKWFMKKRRKLKICWDLK
ncbi:hypothetical protein J4526_07670 [Desulfurococcaceae archaeon MEX13E-LK6-19]|nr:hypothetical protein J4526_07670 [Desulfurococcaceae archaeon MEX13E-LK6-19]